MNFRKKSASVLLGVMALGFSSQMLVSAVDENSNFENKTLQTVSNDPLASDLKNENEGSCLSVDNTNEDVKLIYTDGLQMGESGLSKNSKTVLGVMSSLAAFGGIGYAVKKFVVDKKISQNQEGPEQQVDNKKVLEENEENNNQDSGNSDDTGNTEISSQDQTLEKQESNLGNVILIVFVVVTFIITAVALVKVVKLLLLKYKKRVNSVTIKNQVVNYNNDNGNEQFENVENSGRVNSDTINKQVVNYNNDNGNEQFEKVENSGENKEDFFLLNDKVNNT